jgi:AcrR family transcriptional regulator
MTTPLPTGLRERKKAKTRAAIRDHALRLFEEQGYAATTVDQIVEAADVSQSTFFRYFPTKEDLVLADDFDPLIVAAMRAQPADVDPIEAIRRAFHAVSEEISETDWERERQRQRVFQSDPELRSRAMQQYLAAIELLAEIVAERAGLPPDDFSSRVLAGGVIGAVLAAMPGGLTTDVDRRDFSYMDSALVLLRDGLPVGPRPDLPQTGSTG